MDEEERNFFSLTLLVSRVGNPCLRHYFKNQWDAAGKYKPWTDCAQNGADLLRMFTPSPYEKNTVKSGDTSQWDLPLFVKVLLQSRPPFVVAANLVTALKTLKEMRNKLCHSSILKINAADFQKSWRDGCNALSLFGATVVDFDQVKQDVQKPRSELLPIMQPCADQDKGILDLTKLATSWVLSSKESINFARMCKLLIAGGTHALRDVFDSIHPPSSLHSILRSTAVHSTLKGLRIKKILSTQQWDRLYSKSTPVTSANFDIILLFVLLRNICVRPPLTGWDKLPVATDLSREADLVRVNCYIGELLGYLTETVSGESDFEEYWKDISNVLVRLGGPHCKQEIERLKKEAMDTEDEKYFIKRLEEFKELEQRLHQKKEDDVVKKVEGNSVVDASQAKEYSERLKEAIKVNTSTVNMSLQYNACVKTDDIFSGLTVYHDEKQVKQEQAKNPSRSKQLQEYTKRIGFEIKKFKDIFIDTKGENQKLLLTGKAGIGKTFLCEKIIRDWSMDRLFQNEDTPNIKFAFLLKFRQLSSHGDKEMNLRELLNYSPLIDDNSVIDDSLFEYLTKNPSEVLIILDGFDEYSEQHRKQIASDFEQQYPNDPTAKMPIPALCSKLIKGMFLSNSVVLVSSRPGKAEELQNIHFDRFVEISGFSPEQVTEYVDKYFSEPEKEQTKNTVRERVEKNENLVSFCHIPLLSFLVCMCLEWRITQSGMTENLPDKITDLYDEVVKVFVQKLHANLKYLEMSENTMKIAQETLDKLAKLAAILLKENKYIFDEGDMKELNLSQDEIENLKVSGILHCVPGIRISAFQAKTEINFTHFTFQEFLSASFFVNNKEIPKKEKTTGQTFLFISGILSKKKDGKLMQKLIQQITPEDDKDHVNKLLMLQCLYEYGDDELTKRTISNLYDKYYTSYGWIEFNGVTDVDMKYMSYLLDVFHLLKEQHPQSSSVHILYIRDSPLTSFGVGVVFDSLVRHSFITELGLWNCSLDDKCVEKITDSLVNTGITILDLNMNNISDEGAESICRVIIQDDCHVERLDLPNNKKITAECKERVRQLINKDKPGVSLHIR